MDGLRAFLGREPDHPRALHCLGRLFGDHGLPEAAIYYYRRTLVLDPAIAETLYDLARVTDGIDRPLAVPAGFRRALVTSPDHAPLLCNIAAALHRRGQLWKAESCWRQALVLAPDLAQAYHNLGTINREHGKPGTAIACYRRCTGIDPDHAAAHVNQAMCQLMLGDYAEGWRKYRWRHRHEDPESTRRFRQAEWTGQDIAGRTILLHAEQGYGDTLQFCRYVPLVTAGARVVLEVQPPLRRLLTGMPKVTRVVARGDVLPEFDLHCPLMSLPAIYRTTLDSVPADIPYLTAEPGRTAHWRSRLPAMTPQIGLCWAGHPDHRRDAERSIPLARLRPLLRQDGVGWHILQKDLRPADAAVLSVTPQLADHRLDDFADTAALIAVLDLVVTVDTAIAHLAGALGRPTWLLLPCIADWRWLSGRDDSPWYPNMRIFRQPTPGNWGAVVERLARELARHLARGDWCDDKQKGYGIAKFRA